MAKYKFTMGKYDNPWQLIGDDLSGWVWKHEDGRELREGIKKLKGILKACPSFTIQRVSVVKRNIELVCMSLKRGIK